VNDIPLRVGDQIQRYPTIKLYLGEPDKSVHYAGDRHLTSFLDFLEQYPAPEGGDAKREEL